MTGTQDLELRWPEPADRLFLEAVWSSDARIVRDPKERFYRLPMGYKRAGDILADQAAADRRDRANVIYAVLFCYRQSIELFLKQLIADFGPSRVSAAEMKSKRKRNKKKPHDLHDLWSEFRTIVEERGQSAHIGMVPMEALVLEMHQADRISDGFRYPATMGGAPFDFGDRGIDLANLREVMQGMQNFFECVQLALTHQEDLASESRRACAE